MASLNSSSRFPPSSLTRFVTPVTLPPGRARLSTRPASTGSDRWATITMGIVLVAFLAAQTCETPPPTTIISTLRRTRSAASSGYRSGFPSAYRYSVAIFCPSMWPRSRRACRIASARADSVAGSVGDRYPSRTTFFGCCPWAIAPPASSVAATRIDLKETSLIAHLVLEAITHAAVAKSVICVRYETRSVTFSVWYPALCHTVPA